MKVDGADSVTMICVYAAGIIDCNHAVLGADRERFGPDIRVCDDLLDIGIFIFHAETNYVSLEPCNFSVVVEPYIDFSSKIGVQILGDTRCDALEVNDRRGRLGSNYDREFSRGVHYSA